MKLASFESIVRAMNDADVHYLIAGGVAVAAHGYLRYTKDLDLVIRLVPDNVERAFSALATLGYRPIVPLTAKQFGDTETREGWIREKGMQVLNFWSDRHRETPVDIFVTEPFEFDEEFERAMVKPLYDTIPVRFVCLATLIEMKEKAGRIQDRIDIEELRKRLDDGRKCEK